MIHNSLFAFGGNILKIIFKPLNVKLQSSEFKNNTYRITVQTLNNQNMAAVMAGILNFGFGYCKAEGHGRPPGGRRGQFPRTDVGLAAEIYSSTNTARTPKATLL